MACMRASAQPLPYPRDLVKPQPAEPTRPTVPLIVIPPKPAIRRADGLKIDVEEFRCTGLTVISEAECQAVLKEYVGPDRGFSDLQAAAQAVAEKLKQEGYFLAQAYLPAQTVENGVIEITVLEGRIGKTTAKPERDVPAEDIAVSLPMVNAMLDTLDGEPIRERNIEEALFLVGDLRGISLQSILQPGEQPGTADLLVNLSPAPRVAYTVGTDNLGSRFTGEKRVTGSADWNNPLRRGDSLAVSALTTEGAGLTFWRLSYLIPVGLGGTKVGGAYSQLAYELGTSAFGSLDANGSAEVASVYLLYPLRRGRNLNLFGTVGFDSRTLDDDLEDLEFPNKRDLDVLTLTLVGDNQDFAGGSGLNTVSGEVTYGQLDLRSSLREQIDESEIGRDAEGYYAKLNISATRLQRLSDRILGYVALRAQLADRNLDSSEKLSLGGPNAVRAYAEGEAASDQAAILTIELRTPLPPVLRTVPTGSIFLDHGVGRINRFPLSTDEDNSPDLTAVGLGVAWGRPGEFLVRSTLARGDPRETQFYLQASMEF